MKKSKLIELLNKIPGNPDIALWNGYVQDFQHISPNIHDDYLVKQSLETYLTRCLHHKRRQLNDWNYEFTEQDLTYYRQLYSKVINWEFNEHVTDEDINNKTYQKRRIVLIQPKPRGESTFDRIGAISY